MASETTELATMEHIESGAVMPLAADVIAETMAAFDKAKALVARPDDFVTIQGKKVGKKSLWRRLARAFALSTEIVKLDIIRDSDGKITAADCIARATHPSGASCEAYGGADTHERRGWNKPADIIATAQTRAVNRAISDLIAGGEVTAEEMSDGGYDRDHDPEISYCAPDNPERLPMQDSKYDGEPITSGGGGANHPTEKQQKMIFARFKKMGYSDDKRKQVIQALFKHTDSMKEITYEEGQELIKWIENKEAELAAR